MAQGSGENTLSLQIRADRSILEAGVALVAKAKCRIADGAHAPLDGGAGDRRGDRQALPGPYCT
ncbi:MAG: hypothetical protein EOP66_04740 [Sphingomonas sp.]|nr:MAG: hypothetical protein EOP66_04740 [Sphingomonas sp.]